jgi:hypothetical protein
LSFVINGTVPGKARLIDALIKADIILAMPLLDDREVPLFEVRECPYCYRGFWMNHILAAYRLDEYLYVIGQCPCSRVLFLELVEQFVGTDETKLVVASIHPQGRNTNARVKLDEGFPAALEDDYQEGFSCLRNKEYKASVCMFRRTLGVACELLGAKSSAELMEQIDELAAAGKVQGSYKDLAHQIRIFGNWGAHKQKDILKTVKEENAAQVFDFTYQFIQVHFLVPYKTEKLKKRITPTKSDSLQPRQNA